MSHHASPWHSSRTGSSCGLGAVWAAKAAANAALESCFGRERYPAAEEKELRCAL